MKDKRLFTASFVTVPVINSGMRAPKRGVKVEDLIPGDFHNADQAEQMRAMIEEQEEKRRNNVTA